MVGDKTSTQMEKKFLWNKKKMIRTEKSFFQIRILRFKVIFTNKTYLTV